MRVQFGFAAVRRVEGMTSRELDGFNGGKWTTKEVPRSDFYKIDIPIEISHPVMDERDHPLSYQMTVRIPITSDHEQFPEIVARAKEQLRQDALDIAKALDVTG